MDIIYAKPNQVNTLGRLGENLRRRVLFDVGEYQDEYPGCTFMLLHKPHGYVAAYPVHDTSVDEEFLRWDLTSADMSVEGSGECELVVYSGEVIAKTVIYKTLVLRALSDGGEIPEPLEEWQKRIVDAEENAVAAKDAAETARDAAQSAAGTAENEAGNAADSAEQADDAADDAHAAAQEATQSARDAQAAAQRVFDMTVDAETLEPGESATVAKYIDPDTGDVELRFGIPAGQDGAPGTPGKDGDPGKDGYSPSVEVTEITGGHRVVVYDAEGGNAFDVMDGQDGQDGQRGPAGQDGAAGDDGYSPTASVSKSGGTATITITDKTGTTTAQVSDGAAGSPGADGQDGQDGFSPTASVSKSGTTATITITDKDGTTTATVSDGQNGAPGQDGQDGTPGVDGTTFTPSVAANGDISWTNDGGKTNPQTVNIKGPQGESGAMVVETVTGTTPTITAQDNTRYVCGTVSTLSFTPSASGICDVIFKSGSTATVLTVPSTVKWPDWFDPTALDANTTYEINIMDGVYGAVAAWT